MDYFTHWTQPLLESIPENTTQGKALRESLTEYAKESQTYQARKKFKAELDLKKQTCPPKALQLMLKLQQAIDDEDLEEASSIIFDVDREENLMNIITDLIGLVNESNVKEPKKRISKPKISRAMAREKALDPLIKKWMCCPRCNRPMLVSSYAKHQASNVCIETKAGLKKNVELANASGATAGQLRHTASEEINRFIQSQALVDESDGEGGIVKEE